MDVVSDVALVREKRRPGVQADADLDRAGGEGAGERGGGRERTGCGREGEEEGIPLRVHLDSALGRARLANQPAVLGERLRVRIGAECVKELRRSLDVGEEEGDGTEGEVGPHAARIMQRVRRPV